MYGSRWTRQWGAEPPEIPKDGSAPSLWLLTLANLRPAELAAGFDALLNERREWPPSLSEFYALCRPKSPGVRYLGRPIDPRRALPRKTASEEHRDGCLARIRRAIAGVEETAPHTERPVWERRACTCRSAGTCEACTYFASPASGAS